MNGNTSTMATIGNKTYFKTIVVVLEGCPNGITLHLGNCNHGTPHNSLFPMND